MLSFLGCTQYVHNTVRNTIMPREGLNQRSIPIQRRLECVPPDINHDNLKSPLDTYIHTVANINCIEQHFASSPGSCRNTPRIITLEHGPEFEKKTAQEKHSQGAALLSAKWGFEISVSKVWSFWSLVYGLSGSQPWQNWQCWVMPIPACHASTVVTSAYREGMVMHWSLEAGVQHTNKGITNYISLPRRHIAPSRLVNAFLTTLFGSSMQRHQGLISPTQPRPLLSLTSTWAGGNLYVAPA